MRNRNAYATLVLAIFAGLSLSIYFSFQALSPGPTEAMNGEVDSKPDPKHRVDRAGISDTFNSSDPIEKTATVESASANQPSRDGPIAADLSGIEPPIEPQDFETAAAFFQALKDDLEMTGQEMTRNLFQWEDACSRIRAPKGMILPEFSSDRYRPLMEQFEDYCAGIPEAIEHHGLENLDQNLDTLLRDEPPRSIFDNLDRYSTDEALDLLMRELRIALDRFDESKAQGIIMTVIDRGLHEQIAVNGTTSESILLTASHQVTTRLICRRLNDCRGIGNPFVLKYCLTVYQSGRICSLPNGIDEAIYQTLTPVEFNQYLGLLSWITDELEQRKPSASNR